MMLHRFLLIIALVVGLGETFDPLQRLLAKIPRATLSPTDDPGQPLFLTPYLESGNIDQARNLSRVDLRPAYTYPSYSGYLTVNKTYDSNLFFWFFPSQSGDVNAPLLVWLQGGPGSSSLFGLFAEQGPILVDSQGKLNPRSITWNSKYHLLFIDQPVGTGFSFTRDENGYVRNEDEVARDLYAMLIQFFQIYYEYQSSPFYVTGESYGGKYVPAITYKIHVENPQAKLKINLKGMAIGDGLIDPYNQCGYGPALYQIGLIDEQQLETVNLRTDIARKAIEEGDYRVAYALFSDVMGEFFSRAVGLHDVYNYLLTEMPEAFDYYVPWVTASANRKSIHVGAQDYSGGGTVSQLLTDDIMQSVISKVTVIANSDYKVLIYSGLLDLIIASSLTMNWLDKFEWQYANELRSAERIIWRVDPKDRDVAGYIKRAHSFFVAWVRNAGHMVPADQPRAAFDMIDRFITA